MNYHTPSKQEIKVCKEFLNFVKERNIDKVKEMLQNFETSKFIHIQTFNKALSVDHNIDFYHSEIRKYISDYSYKHLDGIRNSIRENNPEYFKAHFPSYADYSLSGVYANKDNQWEKILVLACEYDNTEVVKFLLTNEKIAHNFDINWDFGRALKTAFCKNNLELTAFLLYSPDLEKHANDVLSFSSNYGGNYQKPSLEAIEFLSQYKNDLIAIKSIFDNMILELKQKTTKDFIEYFNVAIKQEPLNKYLFQQSDIIEKLLIKSTLKNDIELVDYFITSKTLPYNPTIDYYGNGKENAFIEACSHNYVDLVTYFVTNYPDKKTQFHSYKLDNGILAACANNAKESVSFLFDCIGKPYYIEPYLVVACENGHHQLAKDIVFYYQKENDNSLYYLYPFKKILTTLIPEKNTEKTIKEQDIIDTMDYLLNTKEFNPHESSKINIQHILKNNLTNQPTKEDLIVELFKNSINIGYFQIADNLLTKYNLNINEELITNIFKKSFQEKNIHSIEYLIYECGLRSNSVIENLFKISNPLDVNIIEHVKELLSVMSHHDELNLRLGNIKKTSITKKKI